MKRPGVFNLKYNFFLQHRLRFNRTFGFREKFTRRLPAGDTRSTTTTARTSTAAAATRTTTTTAKPSTGKSPPCYDCIDQNCK